MGSSYSHLMPFVGFRTGDKNTDKNADANNNTTPTFDVKEALEYLKPDISLKRDIAIKPNILLSGVQFLALQQHLPPRFQSRSWHLIYSSEYHGFSRMAMQHECAAYIRESKGTERPSILIISAGDTGDIILGAYLSIIPQSTNRRYIGSEESFVFCTSQSCVNSSSTSSSSYGASSSYLSPLDDSIHVFNVPENPSNRYIMRSEDGSIAIGGGGKGPALMLSSDFDTVSSSTYCPTFGLNSSLLVFAAKNLHNEKNNNNDNSDSNSMNSINMKESDLPSGVRVEGGEPFASVQAIQLWSIGDDYFATL